MTWGAAYYANKKVTNISDLTYYGSGKGMFYGLEALTTLSNVNFTFNGSMERFFSNCYELTTFTNVNFDVNKVKNENDEIKYPITTLAYGCYNATYLPETIK
jgi:hypothetical protein